jgi:hypothetical protein
LDGHGADCIAVGKTLNAVSSDRINRMDRIQKSS